MPWLLLDLVLVLISLVFLVLLGLRLWRQVKSLSREISAASARIAPLTQALSVVPRSDASAAREKSTSRVG